MSFENRPAASATIGPVAVVLPDLGVWSEGFESGVGTFAAGANSSVTRYTGIPATAHSGTSYINAKRASGAGAWTATASLSGLIVGRSYTVRGWVWTNYLASSTAEVNLTIGIAGIGASAAYTPTSAGYSERSYTFTATATSHALTLGGTSHALFGGAVWDDFTLTRNSYLDPAGTADLDISEGRVAMDKGMAPYVLADVTVPLMTEDLVEQLDPFANQRVVLTASEGTTSRTFDLVLTKREVSHDGKAVELELATDEAIVQRFKNLTDSLGAFAYQSSLRGIVGFVLATCIPGAVLEAGGAADIPMTVLTDAKNLITDPGTAATSQPAASGYATTACTVDFNDATWSISGDGDSFNLLSPTGSDSYLTVGTPAVPTLVFGTQPGKTYVFSATGNTKAAMSGTIGPYARKLVAIYRIGSGAYTVLASSAVTNTINTPQRVSVEFTVPAGATEVLLRAYLGATVGAIRWDGFRLSEKDTRPGVDNTVYFDGDTTDTTDYSYVWDGATGVSTSRRLALIDRAPESLVWPAGTSGWDFLQPLTLRAGYRLWCDEARKWRLTEPATYSVPGRITAMVSNTTAGSDTIDSSSDEYATGVIARFTWKDYDGTERIQDDTAGVAGFVVLVEFARPYPGPGSAAAILRKYQGRRRTQEVTTASDFTATPAQEVAIFLPGTAAQIGTLTKVTWRLEDGLMDLGSAGLRDTPAGAIDLLVGTIDSLTGTINAL